MIYRALTLALCALAGWTLLAADVRAQVNPYIVDTGPIRIRDQFLLGMGFLAFDPVSADVQEPGHWQFDLIATVTNTFAHSDAVEEALIEREGRRRLTLDELRQIEPNKSNQGIFHLDGELYRTTFAARRGVGKRVSLEIMVPLLSFQGGFVDSEIEGFHDTFGFGQAGRTGVPRRDFQVYARSRGRELFLDDDPGLALGDVVVGSKFGLVGNGPDKRSKLAVEALVKLPTGNQNGLSSSGSYDVGGQLLYTRYFAKACLHAAGGLLYLGEWEALNLEPQTLASGMLAYERSLGAKTSGLLQLTLSQSPFEELELELLAETAFQLTAGVKRVIKDKRVLFLGVTENVQNFANTADLGIHVGFTQLLD